MASAAAGVDLISAYAQILGSPSAKQLVYNKDWAGLADAFINTYGVPSVLYDESGNVLQVATQIGQVFNFDSSVGAVSNYVGGNALVTDATYDVATKQLTTQFGNILSETGEVTKKGLMAGATTGAKVLTGGLAAIGAVATGVNWYRDNPQFWTDVSQKLLPFAYKDPTDKKWSDIFYDALMPTASDSDGKTYVPAALLENMYDVFKQENAFDATQTAVIDKEDVFNVPDYVKSDMRNVYLHSYAYHVTHSTSKYYQHTYEQSLRPDVYYVYLYDPSSLRVLDGYNLYRGLLFAFALNYIEDGEPTLEEINVFNATELWDLSSVLQYGEHRQLTGGGEIGEPYLVVSVYPSTSSRANNILTLDYIPQVITSQTLQYFNDNIGKLRDWIKSLRIDKQSKVDNVTFPDEPQGITLQEEFPDWYKDAVTTVNPKWKPTEPESDENPKYVTWLPLQFPDNADGTEGTTQPDVAPDVVRKGDPTPDDNTGDLTNTAIDDGVLPDPYPTPDEEPSVNPSPQPEPQPQPTPEPTDPSDPTSVPTPTPTPGVPSLGGGTANALWKIYNPSVSILQQFGAWLWSKDPIDLIRQIFNNNPADGVVGVHMIYATPQIGGTTNIKVGYLDSGVASPWVSQQYVSFSCGSVTVPLRYQSALDFGYTKVFMYLPFIGIVPIDSYDVMGKTVSVRYTVDVLTGTVLAQVSVSQGSYSAVLYTFNGSCSVEYPLTSGSRANQLLSLVTGAVGGAVVGGVGGAILGGIRGGATGADVRMSGNLSGNAGAMGIRKPYIIVKRPVEVVAKNYNSFYGYPANITAKLSSFSGYLRVKDVHVENVPGATDEEKREIESLLKGGVIV